MARRRLTQPPLPATADRVAAAALAALILGAFSVARAAPSPAAAPRPTTETRIAADAQPADLAGFKALERRIRETVKKVTPCVVGVSGGSGVVVGEDGYVLTVGHVGERAGRRVMITFPDGRRVRGETLGNDYGVDAGLIKISGKGPWPHAEMGSSGDLKSGQWCLALGYPVSFDRGKPAPVRIGRVLRHGSTMIVTDGTIMGGDSGGPLFDLDGKVIGIGSRCDNRLTTNIYVPVDTFHDGWERLVQGEDFDSQVPNIAYLGVYPDAEAEVARIAEVFPDTGAAKAGIKPGDVILKFDGKELEQYADLPPLIRARKPGDEVEIEVRRGEDTVKLKAVLGRRNG